MVIKYFIGGYVIKYNITGPLGYKNFLFSC